MSNGQWTWTHSTLQLSELYRPSAPKDQTHDRLDISYRTIYLNLDILTITGNGHGHIVPSSYLKPHCSSAPQDQAHDRLGHSLKGYFI